ncbi:ATP-dependent DNA helicase [Trichonephila clavipes]|nr:ATP-dependent DNA helicase [Trichonephila clavipes]
MDTELSTSYPVEFLNSLELLGVPSHKLQLKLNVPVMVMRNLNAPLLCNGTRLRITKLGQNILGVTILTGVGKGKSVIIPRIPIIPTDLPFQFKRVQFPVKLSFAVTINKAQGQALQDNHVIILIGYPPTGDLRNYLHPPPKIAGRPVAHNYRDLEIARSSLLSVVM